MGARPPLYSPRDVAAMFGYKTVKVFRVAQSVGSFPKPDVHLPGLAPGRDRVYWYKSTLDAEQRRREAMNESGRCGGKFLTPKPKGDQA
jgi:hypothetical protein